MIKSKLKTYLTSAICILFATILIPTASVFAEYSAYGLPEDLMEFYNLNNIPYYDPKGSSARGCAGYGSNVNYAGDIVWSESDIELINSFRPIYEEVGAEYNIPWQALATVHSAESGLARVNPSNNQGLYQLYSYKDQYPELFAAGKTVSDDEFREQTRLAAQLMLGKSSDWQSEEGIQRGFYGYNGISSSYYDKAIKMGFSEEEANNGAGSSYVMNRFDAARDPAHRETMSPDWPGRYVADGVYDANAVSMNFGTYTKFLALGGGTGTCAGNMDINSTALSLAWPEYGKHDKYDPSPAYQEALQATGLANSSNSWVKIGSSCDAFVTAVMRYSGVDPNFFCCGIGGPENGGYGQYGYLINHPELYQHLGYISSSADIQPGDILILQHQHIELAVQLEDGTIAIASASYGDRTAEVSNWYHNGGDGYEAFRHL